MKRILVVDDDKTITDLVKLMLETSGYGCTVANSAKDCFDLLHDNKFELILLDVAMPEVTGIDVMQKIKQDPVLNNNKIVFFTASSFTDMQIEDLKKQGILDCIKKPFSKARLLEAMERYLD